MTSRRVARRLCGLRVHRRRLGLAIGVVLVCALLLIGGSYQAMKSRTWQVTGHLVSALPIADPAEKVVALTFDDGPDDADLEVVLGPLRERGVRATFFVTGEGLARHPAAGRRILAEGHELGNHTWDHPRLVLVSQEMIAWQIETTDVEIRAAGQQGIPLFRPPYGKKLIGLPRYLAAHDRTTVMWDVAVETFSTEAAPQTAQEIARATLDSTGPGSIILLHPWGGRVAIQQAIGPIIDELTAQGYRFVTVSQGLAAGG